MNLELEYEMKNDRTVIVSNMCTHIGWIDVPLDDVEDRDVASRLAGSRGNHPVFRLQ